MKIASSLPFVLPEMRPDAREQHGEAKRLRHIVIRARFESKYGVRIGIIAGQHDDRALEAVLAHDLDALAPIHVGQADIHDHEIESIGLHERDAAGRRVGGDDQEFLIETELLCKRVAKIVIIVDQQKFPRIRHQLTPAPHGKLQTDLISSADFVRLVS